MKKAEHRELTAKFVTHLRVNVLLAAALLAVSLLIGMVGYHWLAPVGSHILHRFHLDQQ